MKLLSLFAAVILLTVPLVVAQNGFGDKVFNPQTRNVPAGSVNDPGSELIFLLDSGLNAEARYSDSEDYSSQSVSDFDAENDSALFQNFISITNSNPTDSVTVHFRFINRDCSDILDFLVVLSCNDTMLIDPFDFDIPGTSLNTADRFFGSFDDEPIGGIPASLYSDGRFLLFVTAAGDPVDGDDFADNLFPYELRADVGQNSDGDGDCTAVDYGTVGAAPGGIDDDNLHILNASAIAFNYLTGFYSIAIPTNLIGGDLPAGANDLAYGVRAWARPAVEITGTDPDPDFVNGDGILPPKGVVLSGSEDINVDEDQAGVNVNNAYYLRSEIQGGINEPVSSLLSYETRVIDGALGWTLYPVQGLVQGVRASEQYIQFASLVDDYDGTNNTKAGVAEDWSYGMDAARTQFQVVVFNNDEVFLELAPPDVPVSPPPPFDPFSLVIHVDCITAYSGSTHTSSNADALRLGTFSVQDLFDVGGPDVENFLEEPVGDELGPGWLRFDRLQTFALEDEVADNLNTYTVIGQSVVRFEGFGVSWWLPVSAFDPTVGYGPQ
jgi:hypothetical protein